jgi:hypothetical protein
MANNGRDCAHYRESGEGDNGSVRSHRALWLQRLRNRNGGASVVRNRNGISDHACLPPSVRLHTVRLSSHCLFGDDADHSSPIIQAPSAPPGIPTRVGVGSAAIPRIEAAGVPGIKADTLRPRKAVDASPNRVRRPHRHRAADASPCTVWHRRRAVDASPHTVWHRRKAVDASPNLRKAGASSNQSTNSGKAHTPKPRFPRSWVFV